MRRWHAHCFVMSWLIASTSLTLTTNACYLPSPVPFIAFQPAFDPGNNQVVRFRLQTCSDSRSLCLRCYGVSGSGSSARSLFHLGLPMLPAHRHTQIFIKVSVCRNHWRSTRERAHESERNCKREGESWLWRTFNFVVFVDHWKERIWNANAKQLSWNPHLGIFFKKKRQTKQTFWLCLRSLNMGVPKFYRFKHSWTTMNFSLCLWNWRYWLV